MFPFYHNYPGTDLHEIDLAYILKEIREIKEVVENFVELNQITYADPITWDISKSYPPAQIVKDPNTGILYMSKKPVPEGTSLTDTEYWLEIGNFNYSIQFFKEAICANDEGDGLYSANSYNVNDYLWWNDKLYKVTAAIVPGDPLAIGTNIQQISVTDELGNIGPVPVVDTDSTTDFVTFTRLYYEDAGNALAPDNTGLRQIENIGISDSTIYLAAHNSTYSRLTMIDRSTFVETNIYYAGIVIGCMALVEPKNRIYFSDNGQAKYIDLSTYTIVTSAINTTVQSFGYDETTGKLYFKGLSNYDTFYEVDMDNDTASVVISIPNYLQSGVLQDMAVDDGHIYWTQSNPNIIYKYSLADGSLERVYNLAYRMDKVLPVGELEAITFHNGTCYIAGYNRSMLSGKTYINVIGQYSFKTGEATKSVDYRQYPQILYVDPDWAYGPGEKYVATGWISAYYPKPFTDLWEAIEAAAGLHASTGVRVQISINSPGHTFLIGRIPGDCITQIDGNWYGITNNDAPYQYILKPDSNTIYIENGNITLAHALFKANNTSADRIVIIRRCTASLQKCAVLDPYLASKGNIFEAQQGAVFSSTSEVSTLDAQFSAETIKSDYITNYQNYAFANGGMVDMSTRTPYKNIRINDSGSGVVSGNAYIHYEMTANDTPDTNILVAVMKGVLYRPCITIRYNNTLFHFVGRGVSGTWSQTVDGILLRLSISGENVRVRNANAQVGDIVEFIS